MKNVKIKVQSESDHEIESSFQVRLTCTSSASTPASTLLWRVDQVGVLLRRVDRVGVFCIVYCGAEVEGVVEIITPRSS